METFDFDLPAYLGRLNLSDAIQPSVQGLQTLQRAHLFSIPFENFDVQLGRRIDLSPERLFDKLVCHPRGGYCFEMNGLFLMALKACGFTAKPLLARVHLSGEPSGRGHQLSLVEVDGRQWLADVGFGKENPRGPLLLERDAVQEIDGHRFRLADGGDFGTMLQHHGDEGWRDLYSMDMGHVCQADINYGNHYASTHPLAFFTQNRMAAQHTEEGWVLLINHHLTLVRNGQEKTLELPEGQGFLDGVREHFGIELDAAYDDLKPVV